MLLILTSDRDLSADFLIVELMQRKLPYFRLNTEEWARAEYTFSLDRDDLLRQITIGPRSLDLSSVDSVWYRRSVHPDPPSGIAPGEKAFVAGEMRHLALGLVLNPDLRWVNPIDRVSIAEHKLFQLQIARRLGFRVPRTIVTRDARALKQFAGENAYGTICKPIFHGLFIEGSKRYSIYTRRITTADLDSCDQASPVLLQEEIPRAADVRATFIGERCFSADITGDISLIDWRDPKASVQYAASHLPDSVERACRAMLKDLGLLYGAFDFIRTRDGELVFLEVNPTGEWAWLEERLGFPMRDAFVDLFFGGRK